MKRWRGLKSLVQDAVESGSRAIERVQIETAKRPFDVLEQIPPLKVPVNGVRVIYNASVSNAHGMIRLVTKVTGDTVEAVLDAISPRDQAAQAADDEAQPDAQGEEKPAADASKAAPKSKAKARSAG